MVPTPTSASVIAGRSAASTATRRTPARSASRDSASTWRGLGSWRPVLRSCGQDGPAAPGAENVRRVPADRRGSGAGAAGSGSHRRRPPADGSRAPGSRAPPIPRPPPAAISPPCPGARGLERSRSGTGRGLPPEVYTNPALRKAPSSLGRGPGRERGWEGATHDSIRPLRLSRLPGPAPHGGEGLPHLWAPAGALARGPFPPCVTGRGRPVRAVGERAGRPPAPTGCRRVR